MIPLRSEARTRGIPWLTVLLIAACLGAWAWELSLGSRLPAEIARRAFVPAEVTAGGGSELAPLTWLAAATLSMFLHGGWLHLGGNLLFLWVFGPAVEQAVGHLRFVLLYWLCGLVAAATHAAFNPHSTLPAIGASGAIAGVLGAALLAAPRARIATLVFLGLFATVVRLPAAIVLLLWFALQLAAAWFELHRGPAGPDHGGIPWFAHVGGFLAGPLAYGVLKRR